MQQASKKYLTISQTSDCLGGRSRSSIWRDIKEGNLPEPARIGGRVYFDEQELFDFLEASKSNDAA